MYVQPFNYDEAFSTFNAFSVTEEIKSLLLRNPVSIITKKERTPSFYAVS